MYAMGEYYAAMGERANAILGSECTSIPPNENAPLVKRGVSH